MPEEVHVILLTQDHCKLCDHAREVLARVASDFPIAMEAIDLQAQRGRDMAAAGGVMFPPGIFVEGNPSGTDDSPNASSGRSWHAVQRSSDKTRRLPGGSDHHVRGGSG